MVDPDPEEPHTLNLVQNGNGAFRLDGNQLVVDLPSVLNGSENPYLTVQVWATDMMGLYYDETFHVHVIDATPAYVASVQVTQPLEVEVQFSEPMRTDELGEPSNYTISNDGKGTLSDNPSQVTEIDNKNVRLIWNSGEMKNGGDITVTVTGVFDAQGNPIGQPNSGTHVGGGTGGVPPMLASIEVMGPRRINVVFSESMKEIEPGNVLNPANYRWWIDTPPGSEPTNVEKVAEFPPTYAISWTTGTGISEGQEVTVQVNDVQDLAGNVIDPLHNTASDIFEVTLPRALSLTAVNERTLKIKYSEDMGSSALFIGNYTVGNPSGASGKGTLVIHPSRVIQDTDSRTYILEWDEGEMKGGSLVQIEVQNVKDIYGNLIDPDWDTVVCSSIGIPPYVIDVRVVDSKRIRVLFSEAMEPYMILATRYSLSGPGKGTLSTNPNTVQKIAPDNYLLNWNNGNLLQGEDITVSVSTGTDLAGNYLIEPKSKTVTNRIKILSYLVGGDYYLGDAVVLSFNISGGEGALTYQWLKDGESVGPNSNTWEINGLTLQDAGEYQCYVGDSREEMVYTNKVRLRIYPRMELLQQPEGAIVVDGGHYTLMINITGGIPPINYQWWKDGEPIGGNESMLLIEDMSKEDEGIYWVEVSDAKETIVSKQVEIKYTTGLTSITSFGIVNIIIVIVVMGVLYVRKLNIAQR
ncbi:MAG TPA: hypothetical protein PLT82_04715 [Candidatus Hydrogenedens sp.]|nr:hypothetical protein [Candidatus Hydrogenedens sp.]HOL19198.1 hypothetical protein [Candidatus Hydrogenedens sp.]HPP58414.1 hypothetical protein [Candidatus Hydrogenedens sp.]